MIKNIFTTALLLISFLGYSQEIEFQTKFEDAIPVLNIGTFHMGYTPDANKTEFDEFDQDNVRKVHEIAKKIAQFKPTVIVVEMMPSHNDELQKTYLSYVNNPDMKFKEPSEVELLTYEVGRLSGTQRIYGIDYKEEYNYRVDEDIDEIDQKTVLKYYRMMQQNEKKVEVDPTNILQQLQLTNLPEYLDFLININADMLTYVSTEGKAEGADEAAKFYHRNLVMYSNLNQIELTKNDRVFILMGATHTAFFKMLMERSPKYKLIDVFEYLK